MPVDFDAIVIGSGAGGAAFAHVFASAGKSVLVIERGKRPHATRNFDVEQATLIDKTPYDDRSIIVNGVPLRLFMGGVVGGSTALFGAALLRPSVDDFHPGKHYANRLPRELWDWPFAYEDLHPFYDEAEDLFGLSGTHSEECSPLQPPRRWGGEVIPMAPINERLMAANRASGLRPFRLPLAIDARRCEQCDMCAGFLCPNGARRSSMQLLDEASANGKSLQMMANADVARLETAADGRINGVVVQPREGGPTTVLRASCYALAAGALGSPAILLRSGIDGPQVGRNYMMHYSPIVAGVFPRSTGADKGFVKQVGFADFYLGTKDCPHKLGVVQSLPAPGPLMLAKSGLRRWPRRALGFLRSRMLPLAGTIEDLPNPANRVFVQRDGAIGLAHLFSPFDVERGKALTVEMRRILRRAGAALCSSRSFPSQEHVAHQCGTLRSGCDAAHAVVDAECRMFGSPNLYVADGSVLPTSLGVGPALTIMANALRVARAALAAA